MTRYFLLLLFCAVAAISASAQPTNPDQFTALQSEVRQLRRELVQQRIEFQQWKIEQLETALKEVKEQRETLEAEERAVQQALTDTSAMDGDETATFRTELIETTLKKLRAQQAAEQQRESELQQKLAREQTVLQDFTKRLQSLRAGS